MVAMKKSVWKRIDHAAKNGVGITLSPDDLSELIQHGSIEDEVEYQLQLEKDRKNLKGKLGR